MEMMMVVVVLAAAAEAWLEADRKMRRERGGEGDGMMIVGAWMVMSRVTAGYGGDGWNLAGFKTWAPEILRGRGGGVGFKNDLTLKS
ncbi:hypothetical protein Tco_0650870 [Tanacetum coccineum]